ncbi:MAG: aminotransferase class V-fold PLP-dependent enzyme [Acidobacteria bacterium]|nr:aminotransferase class V-fold PLP-dependent enzyme [Acidobacteriota bacterium]
MGKVHTEGDPQPRDAALATDSDEFRAAGHALVDQLADFLTSLPERPVTRDLDQPAVRDLLGTRPLPEHGEDLAAVLPTTVELLADNSLFNSHPKFMAYITSSAAPVGALGDLIAAVMNPNLGGWTLSAVASEIETQTVQWIAELLRYPSGSGGLLVSGGNVANFIGFLAARRAKTGADIREKGLIQNGQRLTVYCSSGTHTWIQKAADLFGLGTEAVRWIPADADHRMDMAQLEATIQADREAGFTPLLVVGTAGTVGVGAVDPLREIGALCQREDIWFHVDGAYGALAAAVDDVPADLHALALADSVAVDPHKWLYTPLEAGCALLKDPRHLVDAFSFTPEYYFFGEGEDRPINYYELGLQNSRGFRALKVWLGLRVAGRAGAAKMIEDDIALTERLHGRIDEHPDFEARTLSLSISTFRYMPAGMEAQEDLNRFNQALLERLQEEGKFYPSNAIVDGDFLLRACVVNFRTEAKDVDEIPEIVAATARAMLETSAVSE